MVLCAFAISATYAGLVVSGDPTATYAGLVVSGDLTATYAGLMVPEHIFKDEITGIEQPLLHIEP